MKLSKLQEKVARERFEAFCADCARLGTDRNRHDGVAAYVIARRLMAATYGLKYHQAERWAFDWLARNWK